MGLLKTGFVVKDHVQNEVYLKKQRQSRIFTAKNFRRSPGVFTLSGVDKNN